MNGSSRLLEGHKKAKINAALKAARFYKSDRLTYTKYWRIAKRAGFPVEDTTDVYNGYTEVLIATAYLVDKYERG